MPNSLADAVRMIISDTSVFKIGYVDTSGNISKTVINNIRHKYNQYSNVPDEDISHAVHHQLEVMCNHKNNKWCNSYPITRDISKVMRQSNPVRYYWTFGIIIQ